VGRRAGGRRGGSGAGRDGGALSAGVAVLGQVLRATETLPVLAALDVESFAYCGCQKFVRAGERHGAGRPGLGPRCPVQCGNGHGEALVAA
jgi:hypothetical protein